jgi:hypothetical protein
LLQTAADRIFDKYFDHKGMGLVASKAKWLLAVLCGVAAGHDVPVLIPKNTTNLK